MQRLLSAAASGKNRLHLAERLLRGAVGLLVLVPNMALALPAFLAGVALIVTHRFLKGDPSPVDLAQT